MHFLEKQTYVSINMFPLTKDSSMYMIFDMLMDHRKTIACLCE